MILHHLAHLHAYGLQLVLLAGEGLLQSCPLDFGIFDLPVLAGDDLFSLLPGLLPFLLAGAHKSLELGVHGTLVLIELKLVLEVLLSQFRLQLIKQILRMLEGDLDLVDELGAKKFLLLTDLLHLHGREVGNTVKGLTINPLQMVEGCLAVLNDLLGVLQISKGLIKFLLKVEKRLFYIITLHSLLAYLLSGLIEVEIELLGDRFQILLLHTQIILLPILLVPIFKDAAQLPLEPLYVFFGVLLYSLVCLLRLFGFLLQPLYFGSVILNYYVKLS